MTTWLLSLEEEFEKYAKVSKYADFELFVLDYELNNIKGQWNKDLACFMGNRIYNINGWNCFIIELLEKELDGFYFNKIFRGNRLEFSKIIMHNVNLSVFMDTMQILDINWLLKNIGYFDFKLISNLTDATKSSKFHVMAPPELLILSEFLIKPQDPKFSKLDSLDSKLRVFGNVKSFCSLYKRLVTPLEELIG